MAKVILTLDLHLRGTLSADKLTIPAQTIVNAAVDDAAALAVGKMLHLHSITYGQNGTMAAVTIPVHCTYGATGTIKAVKAGSIAPCTGNATATVDVKINGTTCLSSVITLDSTNTARVAEDGTIDTAADDLVEDDLVEIVVTVDAGTGALGTGLFATITVEEAGAP